MKRKPTERDRVIVELSHVARNVYHSIVRRGDVSMCSAPGCGWTAAPAKSSPPQERSDEAQVDS